MEEGDLLWQPSTAFAQASVIAAYIRWLRERKHLGFETYDQLWSWSVTDLEAFWASIAEFFQVKFERPYERILADRSMPGAGWFEGAELNYAENVFCRATPDCPALLYRSEQQALRSVSWAELSREVASVAAGLREMGVRRGDRVVAFMPNIPETVVAFLAAASLGAVWSSCSPDFGAEAVLDRFAQIEPKVLFAVDGYSYAGKVFDKLPTVRELQRGLATLTGTVLLPYVGSTASMPEHSTPWDGMAGRPDAELRFEAVPFDHPLWVLYSSGTTGLPKALVHGHGGVVLEHLKVLGLHSNLRTGDRLFWYTSTGWMMWNFVVGGLLVGATPVLYDGSPAYPDLNVLWRLAQDARFSLFGTSAAYITGCLKAGLTPGQSFDLSPLVCIGSTGSPLPPEGFAWAYEAVKRDLWLASVSGGTDVV
ncbi:MAG: acetoacetate--CoA ligase, partial [Chloroflexota bacterium]|nr:acetoacetate--CoA ligase [Chloroflexota bacterium]